MFHEVVMPIINFMTAQIPRDLQKTGLINGPVFDSISFGVVTVICAHSPQMWANASAVQIKGKKHFRISGFSGVDLTAIFKVRPCLQLLDDIYKHVMLLRTVLWI